MASSSQIQLPIAVFLWKNANFFPHCDVSLQLTFSYFNLEPHSKCDWDSVTIFNGGSPGSPIIGQYCGTGSPGTIQSGSNKIAIVFLADHSVSRGGFMASWFVDSSGKLTWMFFTRPIWCNRNTQHKLFNKYMFS